MGQIERQSARLSILYDLEKDVAFPRDSTQVIMPDVYSGLEIITFGISIASSYIVEYNHVINPHTTAGEGSSS